MSKWKLSARSRRRLVGVHPDLKSVVELALKKSPFDFGITEGTRTLKRQAKLVEQKLSWTMNSRHIPGYAVDIVVYINGKVTWHGGAYTRVWKEAFEPASKELKVPLKWGGNFKRQFDGPHFELCRRAYPNPK